MSPKFLRRMLTCTSLMLLTSFLVATIGLGAVTTAEKHYKRMEKNVFIIKNALTKESPKASYGTGFVIDKNGLLATNYHVVSSTLDKDKKYKLFVQIDGKSIPAKIVAINAIRDVAIVKIPHTFKSQIKLSKNTPTKGQKIYSFGFPKDLKLTITEGRYNGTRTNGVYSNIHMSVSINSGMSGGPVVNESGVAIGVNVSVMRDTQSISFAVPIDTVIELKKQMIPEISKAEINKILLKQISKAQQGLTSDIIEKNNENEKIGKWSVLKPSSDLKCWRVDISDKDHKKYKGEKEICFVPSATYIKNNRYSGTFEIKYTNLLSEKLNGLAFLNILQDEYNQDRNNNSYWMSEGRKRDYSRYVCNQSIIENSQKIKFKINYCLRAYLEYQNLYDIDIKAVSLVKEKDGIILDMTFKGFSKENTEAVLLKYINNIKHEVQI